MKSLGNRIAGSFVSWARVAFAIKEHIRIGVQATAQAVLNRFVNRIALSGLGHPDEEPVLVSNGRGRNGVLD